MILNIFHLISLNMDFELKKSTQDETFFSKNVVWILENSDSISLFIFCKCKTSDFTLLKSYSTELKHRIALFISSIKFFFAVSNVFAVTFRSSIFEQCSKATIFSFYLSSCLIFSSRCSFSLILSSSFSF